MSKSWTLCRIWTGKNWTHQGNLSSPPSAFLFDQHERARCLLCVDFTDGLGPHLEGDGGFCAFECLCPLDHHRCWDLFCLKEQFKSYLDRVFPFFYGEFVCCEPEIPVVFFLSRIASVRAVLYFFEGPLLGLAVDDQSGLKCQVLAQIQAELFSFIGFEFAIFVLIKEPVPQDDFRALW